MVRDRLSESIDRVEGVRSVGGRHDPFMMSLVERLVDEWMVEASMDPVDAEVGEEDEDRELEDVVSHERGLRRMIVHLRVATDFADEAHGCEERHERHRAHALFDFKPNLVLEVLGM